MRLPFPSGRPQVSPVKRRGHIWLIVTPIFLSKTRRRSDPGKAGNPLGWAPHYQPLMTGHAIKNLGYIGGAKQLRCDRSMQDPRRWARPSRWRSTLAASRKLPVSLPSWYYEHKTTGQSRDRDWMQLRRTMTAHVVYLFLFGVMSGLFQMLSLASHCKQASEGWRLKKK